MKEKDNVVSVNILDKIYKIKCPSEQAHQLQQAAQYLTEHMKKLPRSSSKLNAENLAIVAALNITHELLQIKNQHIEGVAERVQLLRERIQEHLAKHEESLV
ncbi:MAG: hypothetical protein A3F10_03200 [Coxiella sp. RIFCSPHIGHO2_12_FULL_42_15]|nr:MAG: hypothetical protein A3F10_03200 [Coxiella sp. RIFCSPHIGHO2_12_FULL_42_15]